MKRDVANLCPHCETLTVFAAGAVHPRRCSFCDADLGAPLPAILQVPPTVRDGFCRPTKPEYDWLE